MSDELMTIVVLQAPEGRGSHVLEVLSRSAGPTRTEPGNIQFDLFQDQSDPDRIVVVETWESAEDLERHHETEHAKATTDAFGSGDFFAAPPIVIFTSAVDAAGRRSRGADAG